MKTYKWIVYVYHGYADKQRGDIISRHKTYEAADRKASKSPFWGVKEVDLDEENEK